MLQAMRSGTHSKMLKTVLFSFLMLASVGMGLGMGVGDIFRGRVHSTTVASIDGDKISKTEFDRILQESLRNQRLSRADAYRQGLTEKAIEREVNTRVFVRAANDLGLYVDDKSVRNEIDHLLEPRLKAGLSEKQALEEVLFSINSTEGRLVNSLKNEMAVEKLSHALADGARAPQQMVDDIMKFRYEARRGEYFKLTAADAGVKAPDQSELETYYKTMQAQYMQPEYRGFAVLVLDAKALGGKAPPSEADAQAWYDAHKDAFTQGEQRVVTEVSAPDSETANKIYDKARASKNLKEAAESLHNKKVTVLSGTYSAAEFMPAEIAPDVFKDKGLGLQAPRQSPLGWHVVRVDKIIPSHVKPFEDAKADILKTLAADANQNSEEMENKINEVDDMIGSGKPLAEVAKALKVQEVGFDKLDAKGKGADGKDVDPKGVPGLDRALAAVFKLDKGQVSQLIQAPGGVYLVAETREIVPAATRPFDAVRAEVEKSWKEKQVAEALEAKAQKLLERVKIGESFDKVAQSQGKSVESTPLVRRNTPTGKDGLQPAMRLALFSIDKQGQATAVPDLGSISILRLAERKLDRSEQPGKDDVEALQGMLSLAMQQDILEQYRRGLMAKYDAKIDYDVIKEQYAPKPGEADDESN